MNKLAAVYGDAGGLADWAKTPDIEPRVPALLAHCRQAYPEHELCVLDEDRLTYGDAVDRSAVLARQLLDAGVTKATRVGMIFPNSSKFIITWLAIVRIGAVAVPISTLSTAAELKRIIRHSDISLLITTDRYLNHDYAERIGSLCADAPTTPNGFASEELPYLRRVWIWGEQTAPWASNVDLSRPPITSESLLRAIEAEVSPADQVSIIYTSGSTAEPKGVIHSHGAFMRQAVKLAATYPYRLGDRLFTTMPFFWVGGLTLTLLHSMHLGVTVLGSSKSGAELLDLLEREKATYVVGWLHLMRALGSDPSLKGRNFSSLRGGGLIEALPEHLRPKNQHFGNALGMTESSAPHTISPPNLPDHLVGSFGPSMPGMQHRIIDVDTGEVLGTGESLAETEIGELQIRGDALMQGMVKREREEVFEPDGWYRTGDLCSFREGHLFFHGRLDDMIKASGANVSPQEVESAFAGIPGISQVLALGVPDEVRGSVVGAVVVVHPGVKLDPQALRAEAAKILSAYKVPRVIITMETGQTPITSSGKLDRRKLIGMLQEKAKEPA